MDSGDFLSAETYPDQLECQFIVGDVVAGVQNLTLTPDGGWEMASASSFDYTAKLYNTDGSIANRDLILWIRAHGYTVNPPA